MLVTLNPWYRLVTPMLPPSMLLVQRTLIYCLLAASILNEIYVPILIISTTVVCDRWYDLHVTDDGVEAEDQVL